jgi:hypothetical protein
VQHGEDTTVMKLYQSCKQLYTVVYSVAEFTMPRKTVEVVAGALYALYEEIHHRIRSFSEPTYDKEG